jgi:di/tricarboxylate transporter
MNTDLAVVLLLLAVAIAMFAVNKPRMDAVALLMLTVLPFTGVITMDEALAGFSDPNIVLIAALFVIGAGLVRTGVAQRVGDALVAKAGGNEMRLLVLLMLAVGGLGAMMSSTGVVAIFIPVVLRLAQRTGTAASRLMMPMSAAALMSGMITLVATAPNLVVNSALVRHGAVGFHFFSFKPFGVPLLLLGVAYMSVARRWLPATSDGDEGAVHGPNLLERIEMYKLGDREFRLRVTERSPLVGQTLGELEPRDSFVANILAVERTRRSFRDLAVEDARRSFRDLAVEHTPQSLHDLLMPAVRTELRAGDILLVDRPTPDFDIKALEAVPLGDADFSDRSQEIGMAEAMVPADSELVGKTLADAMFRTRYGLTVIGLRHGAVAVETDLLKKALNVGDMLLLIGLWKAIDALRAESHDLVVINVPEGREIASAPSKTPRALFCLALMIGMMVSGLVPNVQAALVACLLMVALRCIDLDAAYRAIHWKSLVLIVGMLPFSLALQRTGGVELAADGLGVLTAGAAGYVVLGSLFLITAVLVLAAAAALDGCWKAATGGTREKEKERGVSRKSASAQLLHTSGMLGSSPLVR